MRLPIALWPAESLWRDRLDTRRGQPACDGRTIRAGAAATLTASATVLRSAKRAASLIIVPARALTAYGNGDR
jgi:hypothetical protein